MINNKRISIAARALAIGMVAALVLAGTAMGEVTRTGLVGEWHFDGDAKDSSGNGNDGTIYGATFVDGISGKALSFNGVNNYVGMGDILDFGTTKSFTLSAWIKVNPSSTHQAFVSKYGPPGIGYSMVTWNNDQGIGATGKLGCYARDGTNPVQFVGTTKITDNNWHYVICQRDVAKDKFLLYVDGVLENTATDTTNGNVDNDVSFSIGKEGDNYYYVDGIIDEVRIYNRVLSSEDIKEIYELTIKKSPSLTLTKSLSPSTITEGDSSTVTLRVENTGGDAKSVKITDAIPQGFSLVSGSASQEYATLKATESRTFQYTIKATGTGRFVSDLATVTYQDDKGNSYSGASNSATITVQAGQVGQVPAAQPKTPGFGVILAGIGIILALALRRR